MRGSHRQRSLAGYSLWGCKESDMTEVTKQAHTHNEIDGVSIPIPIPIFFFLLAFPLVLSLFSSFPSIASFSLASFSSWLGFLLFSFRSSFLILGRLLVCRDFCYGVSEIQTLFPPLLLPFTTNLSSPSSSLSLLPLCLALGPTVSSLSSWICPPPHFPEAEWVSQMGRGGLRNWGGRRARVFWRL